MVPSCNTVFLVIIPWLLKMWVLLKVKGLLEDPSKKTLGSIKGVYFSLKNIHGVLLKEGFIRGKGLLQKIRYLIFPEIRFCQNAII